MLKMACEEAVAGRQVGLQPGKVASVRIIIINVTHTVCQKAQKAKAKELNVHIVWKERGRDVYRNKVLGNTLLGESEFCGGMV